MSDGEVEIGLLQGQTYDLNLEHWISPVQPQIRCQTFPSTLFRWSCFQWKGWLRE